MELIREFKRDGVQSDAPVGAKKAPAKAAKKPVKSPASGKAAPKDNGSTIEDYLIRSAKENNNKLNTTEAIEFLVRAGFFNEKTKAKESVYRVLKQSRQFKQGGRRGTYLLETSVNGK
jgi:hypothetical protein